MAPLERDPSPPNEIQTDVIKEIWRIRKNVLIISFAFFFNFLSILGLARLQSSLHKEGGIGVISSGFLFLVFTITCLFIPNPVIAKIGYKWSMATSFLGYILWMAANGYAVWATMLPASAVVGVAAGLLWTAKPSYLNLLARRYASLTHTADDTVITRFFGFFFFFFTLSDVFGSTISSAVLSRKPINISESVADYDLCGFNDCPYYNITNTNLDKPPDSLVWTLVGVYIAIACCAVLVVAIFLDEIPKDLKRPKPTTFKSTCNTFLITLKQFRQKEMLLLIPVTTYITIKMAFFSAEFMKSFVSCTIGIWMIGYFTVPFGIVNTVTVVSSSFLTKFIGRIPLITAATVVDLGCFLVMVFLHPNPDNAWVLLILAAALGFTTGIWRLLFSFYAIVFTSQPDAAFAARTTISSLGSMVAFMYSYYICTSAKLFILISVLITGYTGYLMVEILHRLSNKSYDMRTKSTPVAIVEKYVSSYENIASSVEKEEMHL